MDDGESLLFDTQVNLEVLKNAVSHDHNHLDVTLFEKGNLSVKLDVLENSLEFSHVLDVYSLMTHSVEDANNLILDLEERLVFVGLEKS